MKKRKRRNKKKSPLQLKDGTLHSLAAVTLFLCGILVIVSFSGQGKLLQTINAFLFAKLGLSALLLPFLFFSGGVVFFRSRWIWARPHSFLGAVLCFTGILGFFQTGSVGVVTAANIGALLTPIGSYFLFLAVLVAGLLVLFQTSFVELADWLASLRQKKDAADIAAASEEPKSKSRLSLPKITFPFGKTGGATPFQINQGKAIEEDPTSKTGTAVEAARQIAQAGKDGELPAGFTPSNAQMIWEYPPLSLLNESEGGEADRGDVRKNAATIEATLDSFGIKAKVSEVNYGPSVTQYALEITRGTKLSKITGLATDLALALAAPTGQIRIEAPIAGRSLVGVEVPNYTAQYVTLRKMLASQQMKKHPSKLATSLGISVAGQPVVMDIAKMPHVLIAGATGSGKSVAINAFMCSMLFRASPAEVRFILVDPKRVELTGYNDIPHLLVPVIVEPKKVVSALKWAVHEMEERYKKLAEVGVKNIAGYNELAGHSAMPSIVIIIDELADVMLFAPAEVEESITRIAQMARAVGIHLVLATQRPSVDVITGLIKANIPARIAFNVSSMTDSRVVLDTPGAEKLLGRGDMLFIPPDQAKPSRIQGAYVSDSEIRSLIDFIKAQGQKPEYEDDVTTKYTMTGKGGSSIATDGEVQIEDRDPLFTQAAQYAASAGKGSSSMIQRKFSVGYNRAARILDQLHAAGMVGPQEGSKPREVMVSAIMDHLRSVEAGEIQE
ncbi:MAG: DNA translocase FtsK [Candidatus Pacebacteria bacterium]|nr:DNA translocase FtsK [Candidatus Paceibacterota bacterium]PIR59760.1 MAG: DNA translocase FtsK [Candidatus Pacebacteria bacterium CG10_big_fil_rev_8_21_14_0_10_45_6]